MKTHTMIVVISLFVVSPFLRYQCSAQNSGQLLELAVHALENNPAPIEYEFKKEYATAEMRKGYTHWYGTSQDDPWMHPYVNVFKLNFEGQNELGC